MLRCQCSNHQTLGQKGGACSRFGRQRRCIQGMVGKTAGERDHLENLGVDGRFKLKRVL
jgi:hypothetical protein